MSEKNTSTCALCKSRIIGKAVEGENISCVGCANPGCTYSHVNARESMHTEAKLLGKGKHRRKGDKSWPWQTPGSFSE